MDKKNKKKQSSTPRETFSLDMECQKIIQTEQDSARVKPSRSAVVRAALLLLKEQHDQANSAAVSIQKSSQADFKKAAHLKKRGSKK